MWLSLWLGVAVALLASWRLRFVIRIAMQQGGFPIRIGLRL